MGYSWNPVENLGQPFLMVDEATFVIPKDGHIRLNRSHFKFLFILDGSIEHEIDGVSERRNLATGDILIAPVVCNHTYINPEPNKAQSVHLVRLFLDGEHLDRQARRRVRKPEHDFSDYVLSHFQKVIQINAGIDNEIADLLATLRKEAEGVASGFRHRVRSICTDLIISVSRKLESNDKGNTSSGKTSAAHLVTGVKEYILKHLADEMTLGEIAWHVGKGEEHLARVFKRETGRSVFDYVRESRINRARTLILDPSLNLSEIAEKCGFHSLSFFSRTFRQLTGMPPSEYRRHMKAILQVRL